MPSSRLGALCDRIIEAGWLAAVIATPLFFNVYSSRVFEPDKLTLLRSIATAMAAAWIIKWIEQRNAPRPSATVSMRSALVLPTVILVGVYLLTTLTSITPYVSFFGSYQRLQGTYTTLSYIVVFLMILQGMRTRQQLDRLILTIILTSLPIALYGLIQRYRLDPLPWGGDVTTRVAANMGNAIFVAAYLIMAFFLTLGKIVESFRAILTEEEAVVADIVRAAGYVFVAAVQFIAIVFAGSRGPFLGWFAGAFLFALLLALVLRQRRLMLGFIALGMAGLAFLGVLNMNNGPLEKLRSMPYIGMMGHVFDAEFGTGLVRTLIWEGNTKLVPPHEPLQFPDGTTDSLNFLRPLIGYGPESMYVAYNRFYPPDLAHIEARNASPDRSHNETWDSLVITGVIGLLAYQFLFISFFTYGLRWVGLMPTNRERNIFIGLWAGLGLIGGLATIVVGQAKFFGVGVPAGILAGIIIYLVIFAIVLYGREQENKLSRTDQIAIAALMAAVLAHYIEIHFGIAIASTRTMFWVFAALMVVIGSGWLKVEEAAPTPAVALPRAPATVTPTNIPRHKKRRQPARTPMTERATSTVQSIPAWVGSVAGHALITAIILCTLFYEFVTNAERLSDPGSILWRALTYISLRQMSSYAILGMILLVWLMATLLAISEMARAGVFKGSKDWLSGTALFAALSMGLALVFGLGLAGLLAALTRAQATRIDDLVPISDQVANILNYYYLGVFFLIILAGVVLMAEYRRLPIAWVSPGSWGLVAVVPAILIVFFWVNFSNLNPIRADIIYKQADPWDKQSQWDAAIVHYKHAIDIAPNEDFYYLWLGRALLEKASATNVTATSLFNDQTQLEGILNLNAQQTASLGQNDLLQAARAVLTRAREINPLNTDHTANLARLMRRWADLTTDPAQKAQLTEQASQYYAEATNLSPNNAVLWNEWALVDLGLKHDLDGALNKVEHSMQIDDQFDQTYLIMGNIYMNQNDLDKAATTYQKLIAFQPASLEAYSTLAYIYAQQGKLAEAIQANQTVLKLSPNDSNIWNTYKNLAVLYAQAGDFPAAINSAQVAASTAPTDTKTQLLAYVSQLRAQMAAPPITSTAAVTQ
jgi:tetratricopeptide (TPR) repeat protein